MPEAVRIALRLLGLLLLIVSAACLVLLVKPGPHAVAEAMGVTCAYSDSGPSEQCTWWDAAKLLWIGFWVCLIAGFALRLITRRSGKAPLVLDLRRRRRP